LGRLVEIEYRLLYIYIEKKGRIYSREGEREREREEKRKRYLVVKVEQ
jgi:hypothetical protein